jgi:hypothetical protein
MRAKAEQFLVLMQDEGPIDWGHRLEFAQRVFFNFVHIPLHSKKEEIL